MDRLVLTRIQLELDQNCSDFALNTDGTVVPKDGGAWTMGVEPAGDDAWKVLLELPTEFVNGPFKHNPANDAGSVSGPVSAVFDGGLAAEADGGALRFSYAVTYMNGATHLATEGSSYRLTRRATCW